MLSINLESRLKNKSWWVAIISLIILLSQQCGFDLSAYIPKNYTDIINTIFTLLAALGITVDTSTPGISDEVKTEDSTTAINNTSQSGSDASTSASDKENETNMSNQSLSNVAINSTADISTSSRVKVDNPDNIQISGQEVNAKAATSPSLN